MNDLPIVSNSGTPPGVDRRPKTPRTQVSVGLVVFMLLIVAALGALSWFVWSINSVLNERTEDLRESAERIASLESQMSVSAEMFSESDESMTEKITEWISETRKVWAGYQRHQGWIDENEPLIAQLRLDLDGLTTRMNTIQSSITDIENTLNNIARKQRDLTDELNTTLRSANALLKQLETSVEGHDEDIESIDGFRKQTNTRLLDIQRRLENLEIDN